MIIKIIHFVLPVFCFFATAAEPADADAAIAVYEPCTAFEVDGVSVTKTSLETEGSESYLRLFYDYEKALGKEELPTLEVYLDTRKDEAEFFTQFHQSSEIPFDLIYPLGTYPLMQDGKMVGHIDITFPQEMDFVKNFNLITVDMNEDEDGEEMPFTYPETIYMHEVDNENLEAFSASLLGEGKNPRHYLIPTIDYSTILPADKFIPILSNFLEKVIVPHKTHLVAMSELSLINYAADPKTFPGVLMVTDEDSMKDIAVASGFKLEKTEEMTLVEGVPSEEPHSVYFLSHL